MTAASSPRPDAPRSDIAMSRAVEPPASTREPAGATPAATPARPTPTTSAQAALGNAAVVRRMRQAQAASPVAHAPGEAPTPEGEAAAPAAPAETRAAPAAPALLMPEPPPGLTEQDEARLSRVQRNASAAATAEATMPPATESVESAREAVTEPAAETEARAQATVVGALDERPPPSPEIEELCERIYAVIRSKRPPDEESLVRARPDEMAREAGGQLGTTVQQRTEGVESSYAAMEQPARGQPQQQPQALETPPASVETPEVAAGGAAPAPVPAESVSLDADVAANESRLREAGMDSEAAAMARSGPVAEARAAQGELSEMAERDPAQVLAEQAEAIARAGTDMAALQAQALEALDAARLGTASGVAGQQTAMVGSEEQMRARAGQQMQAIYDDAQSQVERLLEPLPRTAMARWDTGIASLSTAFRSRLRRVEAWIEERHGGGWGAVVSAWDWLTGLPDWVTEEYDRAEREFGDGTCALIRDISRDVNAVIATCEGIIGSARERIDTLVQALPESLQEWAAGEQARLGERLDGLRARATETRDSFNRDLVERASSAVQEVRQQIHGLRQAAGGLVGRIADAVNRFLEDPARFIIDGLLELVGISPPAFWAVVERIQSVIDGIAEDPLAFASTLLAALGQGFQQFFDNIGTHLLQGMLNWLFSKLGEVGVTLPPDLSLRSVITLILQVMGITWVRIRRLLARHIGEENVALIERAWEVVSTLLTQGPEGLFELLKDRLNPQMILDQVLDAAMRYVTEAVISRVTARILLLFNPVGALVQAIEAIYRVLKWVFQNASSIFSLVETVVNGAAALLAGDTGGMANAVEQALARLVGPVLAFVADYAGLGGIPEALRDAIQGLQGGVEAILDRVIGWLAEQGRRLLRAVGLGGAREPGASERGDTELGETVRFAAAGESHRLWVDVRGTQATVMVASTPMALGERLEAWNGRLATLDNQAPVPNASHGLPPRRRAEQLLLQASMRLRAADTTADALAAQSQAGTTGAGTSAPQPLNDDALEANERELMEVIRELFELFGESADYVRALIGRRVVQRRAAEGQRDELVRPMPDAYEVRWNGNTAYIQRRSGQAAAAPVVHIDETGFLREGESQNVQDLSWLATEAVKQLVATFPAADRSPEETWVAVFATVGAMLRSSPAATEAMTLGDLWSGQSGLRDRHHTQATRALTRALTGGGTNPVTPAILLRASSLADALLNGVAQIPLFFVTPTILPREVPRSSDLVRVREGGPSRSSALYGSIAQRSTAELLRLGPGEIHHIIPLYLGGTHEERNLISAEGGAAVEGTVHNLLHELIDATNVEFFVNGLRRSSTLDFTALSQAIPPDVRRVLIGVLFSTGLIRYSEQNLPAPTRGGASSE